MSDTLYIQTDMNVEVDHPQVFLQDVAKLSGSDSKIVDKCRVLPVVNLTPGQPGRYVVSIIDIIHDIQKKEPNLEVTHIGEPSFIITYETEKQEHVFWSWVKAGLVCLVSFFGTAFSIMTFNTDVDINKLFAQVYEQMTGQPAPGFSILEVTYSLGIGLGVLFFFNHFGKKKITQDPTPMQVQMRAYEDDVNNTIIEDINREEAQECGHK